MNNVENSGSVTWKAPSNIAIVKYWGKHGTQLPNNPSLSLTLNEAFTSTSIDYEIKNQTGLELDFYFEGVENVEFRNRILKYLEKITPHLPWLKFAKLTVRSTNSFPHSSGIASSASAMAALSMCLVDIAELVGQEVKDKSRLQSYLARLGSGSACRSIFPHAAIWGQCNGIQHSSDDYAIGFENLHPVFKTYRNDILIVSSEKKSVSSSIGHDLMNNNNYATARYENARQNAEKLFQIMSQGDLQEFIQIAESEALQLHALMMCSSPSFILLEPNSIAIIKKIRAFREESYVPICFTIDAGPNIHVLYPQEYAVVCQEFINHELKAFCEQERVIKDYVGEGPKKLI